MQLSTEVCGMYFSRIYIGKYVCFIQEYNVRMYTFLIFPKFSTKIFKKKKFKFKVNYEMSKFQIHQFVPAYLVLNATTNENSTTTAFGSQHSNNQRL